MHEARICAIKYSLDESIFPYDSTLAGIAGLSGLPAGKSDSLNFYQRPKMQLRRDGKPLVQDDFDQTRRHKPD